MSTIATATLNVTAGTFTVANFAGQGPLMLSGGTFDIGDSTATVASLTQSGGLLTGPGTLTVTGLSTLSGGRESGSGRTFAEGGAAFTSSGFGLDGGRTLELGGSSTATGTYVGINLNDYSDIGAGVLTIDSGATFDDQTTSSGLSIYAYNYSNDPGSAAVVQNQGTFIKSGSAATSIISTTFDNTGTVEVDSGTLRLSGGGTDESATYNGNGTIDFNGGTRTLDSASSVTTANVIFSGGSTTINGDYDVSTTTTINGGTATLAGSLTNLGSALNISNGSLGLSSFDASVGTLTQTGGLLTGIGTLTVTGLSTLSGGRESGSGRTFAEGGAAFTSSGFGLDGGRTLELGGSSTATGTYVGINLNDYSDIGAGVLTIDSGATFDDQTTSSGLSIYAYNYSNDPGSAAVVQNQGTFIKSGSAATSIISTTFDNTGTVEVDSGTLRLSGGGTDESATYNGNGTIDFNGGTRTLDSASSVTTANVIFSGGSTTINGDYDVSTTTTINGGTATLAGSLTNLGSALNISNGSLGLSSFDASVGTLTQTGGLLTGIGTLTVTGLSTLSGGRESGSGRTFAEGGAAFTSSGFGLDGGRTLELGGSSTATGTYVGINLNDYSDIGAGVLTIDSGATFDDQTTSSGLSIYAYSYSNDPGSAAVVQNQGTFIKSGSAATSIISTTFDNTGTVEVDEGTLRLSGGGTDEGATYNGNGTIDFNGGTRTLDSASSITTANVIFQLDDD